MTNVIQCVWNNFRVLVQECLRFWNTDGGTSVLLTQRNRMLPLLHYILAIPYTIALLLNYCLTKNTYAYTYKSHMYYYSDKDITCIYWAFVDVHIPFVSQLCLTVARVAVIDDTIWQEQIAVPRSFVMRTTGCCIKTELSGEMLRRYLRMMGRTLL